MKKQHYTKAFRKLRKLVFEIDINPDLKIIAELCIPDYQQKYRPFVGGHTTTHPRVIENIYNTLTQQMKTYIKENDLKGFER